MCDFVKPEVMYKLVDIADMPSFNPATAGRGDRSVSEGKVTFHFDWHVQCKVHGAMVCASEDRKIWRCIPCGAGAFRVDI